MLPNSGLCPSEGRNPFWMGSAFRWNTIYHGKKAGPRNSGLCPSEGRNPFYPGIFYASAIKKNSRICLKSVFPVILITLRSFFCLEGRNPFYLGKKAELRKFWILTSFYHPCLTVSGCCTAGLERICLFVVFVCFKFKVCSFCSFVSISYFYFNF